VLDLSKIEAGKFALEDAAEDRIEALLGNMAPRCWARTAQDKGLQFWR
jgi:hypothetical protein